MKIYVAGTCQAIPLTACLSLMLPDAQVVRLAHNADSTDLEPDALIFRQRAAPFVRREKWRSDEIVYPGVWFNAFQPDVVFLLGPWGAVYPPLGADNSSIVLYAWHRGMSVAQTVKLFTEPVFEKLRYFDCWSEAKRAMIEEARELGFPGDAMFARLAPLGCFMHSPIHPALVVMADVARELVRRAGLRPAVSTPENYLDDPLLRGTVWPVYPLIASRLGLPGSYAFKIASTPGSIPVVLDLEELVARSFDAYAAAAPDALRCARLENRAYRELESIAAGERPGSRNGSAPRAAAAEPDAGAASPYARLADTHFWRRAVARVPAGDVDPVGEPPFPIDRSQRIATAGSCFAQNMSRVLVREGFDYFVAERAPEGMAPDDARRAGYNVFSARFGNVYTARQLLQLFDRAHGTFVPRESAWLRPDGRFADPFRPHIEPGGFASAADVAAARDAHLAAVRTMFADLDVLIYTLGLTEAWRSAADGAVFPLAPGVSAGRMSADYEFVNLTASEVRADLHAFLTRLREVNPRARVVLTVSPQPPIATYEPRHVLVSAAYTKAALRVAADEIERAWPNVWYFPGYEIVAGGHTRGGYVQDDLRTVTPQGVEHVMRLFLARCAPEAVQRPATASELIANETLADAGVCDEEAIAFDGAADPRVAAGAAAWRSGWDDYAWMQDFDILVPPYEPEPLGVVMEPLTHASMAAPVRAVLPTELRARTVATVACTVRNDGDAVLSSDGRHAVFLCYRWFDDAGNLTEVGRSIHTPLPAPLPPASEIACSMRVQAPQHAGTYALQVALLQSEIAWFDDVDPANGVRAVVDVHAKSAAAV